MLNLFYIIVSLYISWIWVDYYRIIDVYHSDKLIHFIFMFALGAASVYLVWTLDEWIFTPINWYMNGNTWNDLGYTIFKIGALEEFAKLSAFGLGALFIRKHIDEPIDIIAFLCTAALGFAAFENVLYFMRDEGRTIFSRAILTSVGHMMDTALIGYGIIHYKYSPNKGKFHIPLLYFLAACVLHGMYDFALMHKGEGLVSNFGFIAAIVVYLYSISLFAQIINNALNFSPHFTYKKVVNPQRVTGHIIYLYIFVFVALIGAAIFNDNLELFFGTLYRNVLIYVSILAVLAVRMGRFKLEKGVWNQLELRLPFGAQVVNGRANFYVEGDDGDEILLSSKIGELITLSDSKMSRGNISLPVQGKIVHKSYTLRGRSIYTFEITEGRLSGQHFLLHEYRHDSISKSDKYIRLKISNLPKSSDPISSFTIQELGFIDYALLMIPKQDG